MEKSEVLKIIDEVMNNREIDSIRNAILAIRDKVIEAPETDKQIIKAVWEKNENGQYLRCSNCYCSLPVRDDTHYPLIMLDHRYTGTCLEDCVDYCPFCGAKMDGGNE